MSADARNGSAAAAQVEALPPGLVDELADALADRLTDRVNGSPWRDASGIADYLKLSVKSVHRLSGSAVPAEQRIPFHRIGGSGEKRFDVREVDGWLRGREDRKLDR